MNHDDDEDVLLSCQNKQTNKKTINEQIGGGRVVTFNFCQPKKKKKNKRQLRRQ